MRITSIKQDETHVDDGLRCVEMRSLNRVVVIAGANGSGKTRLLNRVQKGGAHGSRSNRFAHGFELEGSKEEYKDINLRPIRFISTQPSLADSMKMTPEAVLKAAITATEVYQKHDFANVAVPYVKHVQDKWWNSRHPDSNIDLAQKEEHRQRYEALANLIYTCLGEQLERDFNSNEPTLFGKTIVEALLSDGQRRLLLWAIDLHARGDRIGNRILILDEPETHVHGEALIEAVNRIIAASPNGQVWIATHSVPLIAAIYKCHLDELSFYCMENGATNYSVESPEVVLKSLLGGEDNIRALREFVDLPEVFANNRFAAQCLCDTPDVLHSDNKNDPQVQIAAEDISDEGNVVRVLDYGSGKGRLLDSMSALLGAAFSTQIDYVAWDHDESNRASCESIIRSVYGSSEERWYSDRNYLRKDHPVSSFDKVVLVNVLHEIPPAKWVGVFNASSVINQSLCEDGSVLIIEDQLMRKGENAHLVGFIVLDTEALQKLFNDVDGSIQVRTARGGRIKSHVVPRRLLKNVNVNTVNEALAISNRVARERIVAIREASNKDFKSGRAHGFWVQQFANTALAMEL